MYALDYEADITIIGGNAVGLVAAEAFSRRGFRVCVLDRHGPGQPHPIEPPAPIGGIATRLLASLGLRYVDKTGARLKGWQFRNPDGKQLLDLQLDEKQQILLDQSMLSPSALREGMGQRLKGNARVSLRGGHAAHELQLDEDWAYVMGETYDQRPFYVRSLFVIDADEQFSVVTQTLNTPLKHLRQARTWLSILLAAPEASMTCRLGFYQGRPLVRMPLGTDMQRWSLAARAGDTREMLSSKDFIHAYLKDVSGMGASAIRRVSLQDYPMTMREKLWQHRTVIVGGASVTFSDEQSWLGDSVLDTGLADIAALIWPLSGVLLDGLTLSALTVWEQKRLGFREERGKRHRRATELVFKPQRSGAFTGVARVVSKLANTKRMPVRLKPALTVLARQAAGGNPASTDLRSLVLEPTFLTAGPLLFNAGNVGLPIPSARIKAAFDQDGHICQDTRSFNEFPIATERLDVALPPGYAILTLGYDPEQILPPEAVAFWQHHAVIMLRINPKSVGPRPKSVCDIDGTLTDWINFGQTQSRHDFSMVLITPERYCAAMFSPAQSFKLIELFCLAYGLPVPDFVHQSTKISVVSLVSEEEEGKKPSVLDKIKSYAEKHGPTEGEEKSKSE